jgi:hypothetical protein
MSSSPAIDHYHSPARIAVERLVSGLKCCEPRVGPQIPGKDGAGGKKSDRVRAQHD